MREDVLVQLEVGEEGGEEEVSVDLVVPLAQLQQQVGGLGLVQPYCFCYGLVCSEIVTEWCTLSCLQ